MLASRLRSISRRRRRWRSGAAWRRVRSATSPRYSSFTKRPRSWMLKSGRKRSVWGRTRDGSFSLTSRLDREKNSNATCIWAMWSKNTDTDMPSTCKHSHPYLPSACLGRLALHATQWEAGLRAGLALKKPPKKPPKKNHKKCLINR